ncbi:hypothetical protein [Sphaerothrix gracilis]|uniref:hypothetical protein n=1 Tax=Sphaerothrix gracilis TaxID=3151835 RepID=UPI0031FDC426
MTTFRIFGRVIDRQTRFGLAKLNIEAWDKDLICNDLVGSTVTDEHGNFQLEFDSTYFQELFFDRQPDLFFKIFNQNTLIKSTENSVLWNVAAGEKYMVIAIDRPAEVERERRQFRALLLNNPNYFGNVKTSPFQPVTNIQLNTRYEEIGCVGFQPQFNRLEAVIYINQPAGYGGGICSSGTPEYVRFYLSFDGGATWVDQGYTSFKAYDIPTGTSGNKRLEYAVSLSVKPPKKFCSIRNLIQARAILSWNAVPPADEPNFAPVWGDVHDTHIQVDSLKLIVIDDLLQAAQVKLPPQLANIVDLSQAVPAAQPKALEVAELKQLYQEKNVEPHRYALTQLQTLVKQPAAIASLQAANFPGVFTDLDIDLPNLGDLLFPTDGSTRYEELECIGLNREQDTLVGILRIKQSAGYSGGPCTQGSREYVTFWADFDDNGTFETCLGTTSVQVYDIEQIPEAGLEYSVFLPVDFTQYRQPCQQGAKLVKIRAILSWQSPPPCSNPNYVPVWGNREETLIQIKPGIFTPPDIHTPIIQTAGSMDVDDISSSTGLANGPAALAGFTAIDSPFGGVVILTGHLANTTDISQGAANLKYRVEVSNDGFLTFQTVNNSFTLGRDRLLNGIWSDLPSVTQSVDAEGFYEYQEDLIGGPGNPQIFPVGNVLARWNTAGLSGLWQIRIRAKDPADPGPVWFSNVVTVRLDNIAPSVALSITSGGGNCADFTIGDLISGTYSATDEHFGSLRLMVLPDEVGGSPTGGAFTSPAPYPGTNQMPLTRAYSIVAPPGVPTTGESGNWTLDTSGMPRCGYVIELRAWDRTIVNSGSRGRSARDVVGLCLRQPEEG